ncbi:hypothetical protein D3C78_1335540 [compost metagenome]
MTAHIIAMVRKPWAVGVFPDPKISNGATIMMKIFAISAPSVLKVDREVLSTGFVVITEAIEPYGIFMVEYNNPQMI